MLVIIRLIITHLILITHFITIIKLIVTMVSFSVVATLIASVSALGINCRGSGSCPLNEGASLTTIITQMKQLIVAGKGNQWYNAGGMYFSC